MRFLFVDRILELESGKCAVGIKNVTMTEDVFAHHFPDTPIMPGALIVEALVQLADWVVREASDFRQTGQASSLRRAKFRRMIKPGDQLRLEVEIVSRTADEVAVVGKAYCEERLAALAEFSLALHPLDEWLSPDEARHHYRLIGPREVDET